MHIDTIISEDRAVTRGTITHATHMHIYTHAHTTHTLHTHYTTHTFTYIYRSKPYTSESNGMSITGVAFQTNKFKTG